MAKNEGDWLERVVRIPSRHYNKNLMCLGKNKIIAPAANSKLIRIAREEGPVFTKYSILSLPKELAGPNAWLCPLNAGSQKLYP